MTAKPWKARIMGLALAGALASACTSEVAVRGNLPAPEDIAEIHPGVHSRADVAERLGSPSTLSTFKDRTWYYIGHKAEQTAFFRPEVKDRGILVITFRDNGIVEDMELYTLEDTQNIDLVERETPTEGSELTFLQQLIGNLGRFPVGGGTAGGGVGP